MNHYLEKFYKFTIGGAISYGLKIFLTYILTEEIGFHYLYSYSIVLVILMVYSFLFNKHITFKSKRNKKSLYLILFFLFIFADLFLVYALTDLIGLNYLVSIIIVTTTLFIVKFFTYDRFVFKNQTQMENVAGNYYDKHHSKNPIVKFLMKSFHKQLLELIDRTESSTLLDAGCGEGYTTREIKETFDELEIKGVELEEEALEIARSHDIDITFVQGNIYNLKEEDNSFDTVIATEVLEHLDEPENGVKETRRVAKNYCIYTVPYEPIWRMANMVRGRYLADLGNTPGHLNHWSRRSLRNFLEPHFETVEIKNCYLWNMAICKK